MCFERALLLVLMVFSGACGAGVVVTGKADAGADAATQDAGAEDGGRDAGSADAGPPDAGETQDAGEGVADGGPEDAGREDAGPHDAGAPDAGTGPEPQPGFPIYGVFGWSPGAGALLSGKPGWSVEFLRSEVEWADPGWWGSRMDQYAALIAEGFTPITRLSFTDGATVPADGTRCDGQGEDDFAVRAAHMASAIRDRHGLAGRRFIVGNEPNHPAEGELDASLFAACHRQVYQTIKAAWPEAIVMPATVAPWAPKDWDCAGDATCAALDQPWKRYLHGMIQGVGGQTDAYDLHTYGGRGGDRDPGDDGEWGFGVFETSLAIMAGAAASSAPVYITEFNHGAEGAAYAYDASWAGFVQRAHARIDAFNAGAGQGRIKSLCWFTYDLPGWEHYNLADNGQAAADFAETTRTTDYRAP